MSNQIDCCKPKKKKPANTVLLRIGADNGGIKLKITFSTVMIFALFMSIGFVVGMSKLGLCKKCQCCEEE